MILIHELGHYFAARSVGVKVDTFSIGFGPRLFGFRRGETDFRLSAVPFGGYVRMMGELPGDETVNDPRSFQAKSRWQRAIVVFAGPLMNILLAVAIVTGLFMHTFTRPIDPVNPVISSVTKDSPAARAGVQSGDKIIQVAGQKNPTWQDVQTKEILNAGHSIPVVVLRHGQRVELSVTPRQDPKLGVGMAGWVGDAEVRLGEVTPGSPAAQSGLQSGDLLVSINGQQVMSVLTVQQAVSHSAGKPVELGYLRNGRVDKISVTPKANKDTALPWRIGVSFKMGEVVKLGFGPALVESVRFNVKNATLIFQVLGSIVERRVSPKTLEGPIGIAKMSGEAAKEGALSYFFLMAIVSLNLAIFNLLPIPILDGGMLLMLFVEMILRRDVSMQVKETVFKFGFVFLMMIVVFAIYNDISKILVNG